MALDIVSPRNCVLLFGVPMDSRAFVSDLQRADLEYARNFSDGYPGAAPAFIAEDYERLIAKPLREVAGTVSKWGVEVCLNGTLEAVRDAFGHARVVALVAHTQAPEDEPNGAEEDRAERAARRHIELRDGPATIRSLSEAIPKGWNGIVDMIVCKSKAHAYALKRDHPEATFIVNTRHASPVFRIRFFESTIALLRREPQPYGDAVCGVLRMLAT
jgi:hypothetical protein